MSKATNDNVLGRGLSRQSSNLGGCMCDINFSAIFPRVHISAICHLNLNSNSLAPLSHALSTFNTHT